MARQGVGQIVEDGAHTRSLAQIAMDVKPEGLARLVWHRQMHEVRLGVAQESRQDRQTGAGPRRGDQRDGDDASKDRLRVGREREEPVGVQIARRTHQKGPAGEICLAADRVTREIRLGRVEPMPNVGGVARHEGGVIGPKMPKGDLGLAPREIQHGPARIELDVQALVLPRELGQARRKPGDPEALWGGHLHRACEVAITSASHADEPVDGVLNGLKWREERLCVCGEGQAHRAADKEGDPKRGLGRRDPTPDGRVVNPQLTRRSQKRAATRDRRDKAEIVPIHRLCIFAHRWCMDVCSCDMVGTVHIGKVVSKPQALFPTRIRSFTMRILAPFVVASLFTACDGPVEHTATPLATPPATVETPPETPTPPAEAPPETPTPPAEELPFLVSRYSPTTGLTGTRIQILTAFDSSGCRFRGECAVTIDDQTAEIVADEHILEVIVPRFVATGPLCVTWRGRTECSSDFQVLDKPMVRSIQPAEVKAGTTDVVVSLTGDGFTEGALLLVGADRLEVVLSGASTLSATIPAAHLNVPGPLLLNVYVPDVNRCGAISDTVELIVTR